MSLEGNGDAIMREECKQTQKGKLDPRGRASKVLRQTDLSGIEILDIGTVANSGTIDRGRFNTWRYAVDALYIAL